MGLMGAAFLLRSQYERNCLSTEEFVIRSPKITGKEKTFVFLSDLHDKEFGPDNRRLLQAVSGADPDAVFIEGNGGSVGFPGASFPIGEAVSGLLRQWES